MLKIVKHGLKEPLYLGKIYKNAKDRSSYIIRCAHLGYWENEDNGSIFIFENEKLANDFKDSEDMLYRSSINRSNIQTELLDEALDIRRTE